MIAAKKPPRKGKIVPRIAAGRDLIIETENLSNSIFSNPMENNKKMMPISPRSLIAAAEWVRLPSPVEMMINPSQGPRIIPKIISPKIDGRLSLSNTSPISLIRINIIPMVKITSMCITP